jgi:hypothetical protein
MISAQPETRYLSLPNHASDEMLYCKTFEWLERSRLSGGVARSFMPRPTPAWVFAVEASALDSRRHSIRHP